MADGKNRNLICIVVEVIGPLGAVQCRTARAVVATVIVIMVAARITVVFDPVVMVVFVEVSEAVDIDYPAVGSITQAGICRELA